MTTFQITRPFI